MSCCCISVSEECQRHTSVKAGALVLERDQSSAVSVVGNAASDASCVQGEPSAAMRRRDGRDETSEANAWIDRRRHRLTSSCVSDVAR